MGSLRDDGEDGGKVGLPALDITLAFPQATPTSLFPSADEIWCLMAYLMLLCSLLAPVKAYGPQAFSHARLDAPFSIAVVLPHGSTAIVLRVGQLTSAAKAHGGMECTFTGCFIVWQEKKRDFVMFASIHFPSRASFASGLYHESQGIMVGCLLCFSHPRTMMIYWFLTAAYPPGFACCLTTWRKAPWWFQATGCTWQERQLPKVDQLLTCKRTNSVAKLKRKSSICLRIEEKLRNMSKQFNSLIITVARFA